MDGYGIILFLSVVAVGEGISPFLEITGMSESLPNLCLVDYKEDTVSISIKVVEIGCQTASLTADNVNLELYKITIDQNTNTVNVSVNPENIDFNTSEGAEGSEIFHWDSRDEGGANIGVYAVNVTFTTQSQQYSKMGYFVIGCMDRSLSADPKCTKGNSIRFLKGHSSEVYDLRRCQSVTTNYRATITQEVSSSNNYKNMYDMGLHLHERHALVFQAKRLNNGNKGIKISLSPSLEREDSGATEIGVDVTQGDPTGTYIKRQSYVQESHDELLSMNYKDFWISWGDSEIRFGTGLVPYREEIMRGDILIPNSIYMFISGNHAEWKFEIVDILDIDYCGNSKCTDICQDDPHSCGHESGQHWYYDKSKASCTLASCPAGDAPNCFQTEDSCLQGCKPNSGFHYMGCYRNSQGGSNPLLSVQLPDSSSNTIDSCISRCITNSATHLYAGMRDHNKCYCGDELQKPQKYNNNDCDKECTGMPSQMCGGEKLPYGKACSSSIQCATEGADCFTKTCTCGPFTTYNPTLDKFNFKNNMKKEASLKFSYSPVPTAGSCTVLPTTGFALLTDFSVSCSGFSVSSGASLTFTMMSNTVDSYRRGSVFCSGCGSSVTGIKLPVGDSDEGYRLYILVTASVASGASVQVSSQVTVRPPDASSEGSSVRDVVESWLDVKNKGKSSTIKTLLETGKQNDAVQYLSIMSSSINAESDEDTSSKREFRKAIVSNLEKVKVDSYETVSTVTEVLNGATQEKSELSETTQTVAMDLYDSLADSLVQYSAGSAVEDLEESAGDIMVGVTRLLEIKVVKGAKDTLKDSFVKREVKNSASKLLGTVKKLSKRLLSNKIVDDAPTILQTDTATVQIEKVLITDLLGRNFTVDDNYTSLSFPSSIHDLGVDSSNVGIEMLHIKTNPYVWHESALDVNTEVLSFELKHLDDKLVIVDDLSEPVTIRLKLPELEATVNSSLLTLYIVKNGTSLSYNTTWSNLLTVKFTVPQNKMTVLSVTIISQIERVKLLVTETRKPSFEDVQSSGINYPDQFYLLKSNFSQFRFSDVTNQTSSNIYFTYKENADVGYNGIYYVGIAADLNDSDVLEDLKLLDNECLGNETAVNCTAEVEIMVQLETKTLGCSYWDTQSQSWSSDGCEVSPFSTASQIECFCTHLTAFAGGVFVLPNFVNPADIELFLTFFDNPVVVTAVVVVWILYFFLIYWARHADRKDLEKVGVIAIGDVDMVHKHMYLVCVVTGWWAEAGTSANVFFYMKGTDGTSKRMKLTSAVRPCFQTGYEDWFLIATDHSLGDLQEVTMWHDNTGSSPHWYLSQVFVKDLHEKRSWTFIYNDWLAVDRGSILRTTATVKATTPEQLKLNKKHNFLVKSTQDLRNSHIWISIFSKTARSTFTRAQRLTCALSLLLTTMLTNIMFYGIPTDDPEDQVSSGGTGITISLSSIVIGIQSSLIMFPVNLIIMQLFLKLKSRPAQTEEDKKAKTIFTKMMERASLVVTRVLKKVPSDFMLDQSESQVSSKESVLDIDNPFIPVNEDTLEVSFLSSKQSEAFKQSGSNASLAGSFKSCNANLAESTVDSGFVVISETKEAGKILPWWFLYITWILVLAISLVCSYFIMLYGLKYGYQTSLEWLVSFFTGFSQSAFITQPLKVLAVAIVITLILKKTVEFEDYGPEVRLDEDDLYTSSVNKQEEPHVPFSQPLSNKLLKQIRKRLHLEWLMNVTLRDIGLYFIYMAVVSIVVYGHTSVKHAYRTTVAIEDYMVNPGCTDLNLCFLAKVDNVETYYQYLNDVAVPCLADYAISDHEYATPGSSHFLVGPWRLRQLRIASGTCSRGAEKLFKRFNMNVPECTGPYWLGDEERQSFNMSWARPLSYAPDPPTPWTHQSAWNLKTIPCKGTLATYSGGGYIVTMPSNGDLHHGIIKDLWNSDWIDEKTRAVFVEFTLYNPNADLFSVVMIIFEFSNNGAVIPSHQIFSTQLYHYSTDFSIFVAVCECLFLIFNITFAVIEWKKLRRLGRKEYFQDPWSYVEWIKISLSFSVVGLFFQRMVSLRSVMEDFRENIEHKYISFYTVISWDYILGYVMAFLVAVVTIKAIKLLRFHKRTYMVADTIAHSKAMILSYLTAFIIFCIAFSHFGTLVFGKMMGNYRDMMTSLFTVFNFSLGVSDLLGLQQHSRVLGPIFFFIFVCMIQFIFFTVFMAILNFGISESKATFEKRQNQFELLEYIILKIKTWANLKYGNLPKI